MWRCYTLAVANIVLVLIHTKGLSVGMLSDLHNSDVYIVATQTFLSYKEEIQLHIDVVGDASETSTVLKLCKRRKRNAV